MKIADSFEDAGRRQRTSSQMRKVMYELHEEITGQELSDLTVREWLARYLSARENEITATTLKKYRTASEHFLGFLGEKADTPIIYIAKEDIAAFRDHLASRLSTTTANGNLKIVKSIFRQARRDDVIIDNPAEDVMTLRTRTDFAERCPFTTEELGRIIAKAEGELLGIILVGYFTGLRLGDIALLGWNEVNLDTGKISLVTSKTGRRQLVPIHQQLQDHLESLPGAGKKSGYVFPESAERVNAADGRVATISNRFTKLLSDLGFRKKQKHRSQGKGLGARRNFSPYTFHSLRHSFTSHLKDAGVSETIAMELVGHDSVAINRHYTHLSDDVLRGAVDSLPKVEVSGGT